MMDISFWKRSIAPDLSEDVLYGTDQVYDSFPCTFPTVNFYLVSTDGLDMLADMKRWVSGGHLPMAPREWSQEYDLDGWYDFYIGLNGFSDTRVDGVIEFVVRSPFAEDDERVYYIDLSEDDQIAIYNILDEACRQERQMSCEDLLREAEEEMKSATMTNRISHQDEEVMMIKKQRKRVESVCDELDWCVSFFDDNQIEFEKYSPAGEDFVFCVEAKDISTLTDAVTEYYENFDPEEHAAMWVEARQHGTKCIPSIRRLIIDADDIDNMLRELATALSELEE